MRRSARQQEREEAQREQIAAAQAKPLTDCVVVVSRRKGSIEDVLRQDYPELLVYEDRFYEITKREHVSSRKAVVVVIAASMEGVGRLEGYEGDAARDFLGIGGEDAMLHPSEVPLDHVLFIQSASVNRHVLPGVKLLLFHKGSGTATGAARKKARPAEPILYDSLQGRAVSMYSSDELLYVGTTSGLYAFHVASAQLVNHVPVIIGTGEHQKTLLGVIHGRPGRIFAIMVHNMTGVYMAAVFDVTLSLLLITAPAPKGMQLRQLHTSPDGALLYAISVRGGIVQYSLIDNTIRGVTEEQPERLVFNAGVTEQGLLVLGAGDELQIWSPQLTLLGRSARLRGNVTALCVAYGCIFVGTETEDGVQVFKFSEAGVICIGKIQPPAEAPLGYRPPSGITMGKEMQLCVCSSLYVWCVDLVPATAQLNGLQPTDAHAELPVTFLLHRYHHETDTNELYDSSPICYNARHDMCFVTSDSDRPHPTVGLQRRAVQKGFRVQA